MNDYTPKPGSLAALVVGYFTNHPDAQLTLEDIVDQFKPTNRTSINTQLAPARESGLLARYRNDDGEYIYQAGSLLRNTPPAKAENPAAQPAPFDPLNVTIEDGIPLPRGRDTAPNLHALLERMKTGQSAQLPKRYQHSIAKVVTAAHKAGTGTFTTLLAKDADTLRIWRVK